MSFTGGGACSTLFHLLARRPVLVPAIGLAVAVGIASRTSVGPGLYDGAGDVLEDAEAQLLADTPGLSVHIREMEPFLQNELDIYAMSDASIRYVVTQFDCNLDIAAVREDPELMRDVARLYYMDLYHRYGSETARVMFFQ